MTESPLQLAVIGETEAFALHWPQLAERHGLELVRLTEPGPVRRTHIVAVILVCAGRESHAVELLHETHRAGIEGPLVVGAEADHRLAVELMRRGAAAYYALPGDVGRLSEEIAGRLEQRGGPPQPGELAELQRASYDFSRIVGEDPGLRAALARAAQVIPAGRGTVLITGETGTGKELLAQAIHYNGPRSSEPFVTVNCAAIPSNLLESELFGHEKGAFTDARSAKPGLFQLADGGTLFLDEAAMLPLDLQGKLLRVLESGEVRRVGGLKTTHVDVRILAAANVDLRARVREGEFREDLYYRLAVIPIHLPPLRDRGRDARLLARHLLAELAATYQLEVPELTSEALHEIDRHSWPGNVRELRNAIERALLLSGGRSIRPDHLALAETSPAAGAGPPAAGPQDPVLPFPATLETLEEEAARAMLARFGGNKSEAARRLGITRSRLYRILNRCGGE